MTDSPITYIPPARLGGEGSHQIDVAGRTILVKGDGRTTTRKRYQAALRGYQTASNAGLLDQIGAEAVVGSLVLAGVTDITVDGEPLFDPVRGHVATLIVDISTALGGEVVHVRTTGGGE